MQLSSTVLRKAVLQLLYLAVEYEHRHEPLAGPDASDRKIRRDVQELTYADATLREFVGLIDRYREDRQALVAHVRTAQAVADVAELIKKMRQEWDAEQLRRKKEELPRLALKDSASFREALSSDVKKRFAFWDVPLSALQVTKIIEEATKANVGAGLQARIATAISNASTPSGRTTEGLIAALKGRPQSQGRIKDPAQALHALLDEPTLPGRDVLEYVLHLIAAGRPESVIDEFVERWVASSRAMPRPPQSVAAEGVTTSGASESLADKDVAEGPDTPSNKP
ncbi:hypothetical protein [Polyangium aurulentum]|uniref:hypothetical protein n=1 Tax=Polyangium aurulentum TaxID=2567896 RepID=UPI0010ADE619|nr:hypothetical protein [Polyangium aurulentum]UQA57138.1 hypothetical protein E8A73_038485 [Polyangium aurulentum]